MTTKLWQPVLRWADTICRMGTMFDMRRRLNPHHSKADIASEKKKFDEEQSHLFFAMKRYYTENHKELVKELSTLPTDLQKQAQEIVSALDKCIADDIERTLLADPDRIDP